LRNDPQETNELAKSNPEQAQQCFDKLVAWRKSVGAQMMTDNPNYAPSR
jgi:hypothetical protein